MYASMKAKLPPAQKKQSVRSATREEIDAFNHTNLVRIEAKEPTHLIVGNTEHWYCDGCNKYFSDEAGTNEISLEDTIIPAVSSTTDPDNGGGSTTGTTTPSDTSGTGTTTGSYTSTGDTASPQTGDSSTIAFWIILMLAAGSGLTGVVLYSRKRKYSR